MKRLLLFGGTTEARQILHRLAHWPLSVTLRVATEYEQDSLGVLPENSRLMRGRMDREQILAHIRDQGYFALVDAAHPYASQLHDNVRAAAEQAGIPCLRLVREQAAEGFFTLADSQAAVDFLQTTQGPILLTTGSKDLALYTQLEDYAQRVYPRVLPMAQSIQQCHQLGYRPSQVIAMQGPFSRRLNQALLEEFSIAWLVTKDSGPQGGFWEKIQAAQATGAQVLVIGRPWEEGLSLEEVLEQIKTMLGGIV